MMSASPQPVEVREGLLRLLEWKVAAVWTWLRVGQQRIALRVVSGGAVRVR